MCKARDLQVEAFLRQQIRLQQSDGFDLNEIVIARQAEIARIREIGSQILMNVRVIIGSELDTIQMLEKL